MDARALAHFADVIRPTPRPLPDTQTQELRALLGRRQQLIGMRTAEQNRLAGTSGRLAQDIEAPMARAFNMCGDFTAPNLYAVAQQNCLQVPDTRMTVMG